MNTILLITFIVLEIGFIWIRNKEKGIWQTYRFYLCGMELVLYLLCTLLPGIDLSFRYFGLFILLGIRVLIELIFYLLNKNKMEMKKRGPALLNGIFSILLIVTSLLPSYIFADYKDRKTTGRYEVAQSSAILVDESRIETFENDGSKREVPVHFYYPETTNETFPLVIFSHGAFGYYQSNTSTYKELASNGYVVISLDHPYHSFFCKDTKGNLILVNSEFLNEVMQVNDHTCSEKEILDVTKKWLDIRTSDISFVIDQIELYNQNNQLNGAWHTEEDIQKVLQLVDVEHIGVMGHSLGGASAVELGRIREDIDAVIDLDGTMLGENREVMNCEPFLFENEEYTEKNVINETPYPIPVFAIDSVLHHESREEAKKVNMPYANNTVLENAKEGYETYILNTAHMNFTDLPLISPFLAKNLGTGTVDAGECIDQVNQLVLEFFNATLKDQGPFIVKEYYGN